VPTRIRKVLADDKTDALMLAKAGLDRLGSDVVPAALYVSVEEEILPAPAQGAIAIQCRAEDAETLAILARIHHEDTARCVHAERHLLAALGGGCHLPLGTLARVINGRVVLRSVMFDPFPAHS
jgi:hydroxymethylbilane synthase